MLQVEINASILQCILLDPTSFESCYVEYSYGEDCEASPFESIVSNESHIHHINVSITNENPLCYIAVAISNSTPITVILRGRYCAGILEPISNLE